GVGRLLVVVIVVVIVVGCVLGGVVRDVLDEVDLDLLQLTDLGVAQLGLAVELGGLALGGGVGSLGRLGGRLLRGRGTRARPGGAGLGGCAGPLAGSASGCGTCRLV